MRSLINHLWQSTFTLTLVIGMVQASSARQTQNQALAFEVASVKPSPTNRYIPAVVNPQRFRIVTTLAGATLWAYDVDKAL